MLNITKRLVATVKRMFAAFWAWALRHEYIGSFVLVTVMGLAIGGFCLLLDFLLVA